MCYSSLRLRGDSESSGTLAEAMVYDREYTSGTTAAHEHIN